jgi:uridine phosphorylase
MKPENINREFLDSVVSGNEVDSYYHLGISSDDPIVAEMRNVKAVVMGGSGGRMRVFAEQWAQERGGSFICLPKEDRFTVCLSGGVLFASHGMGTPSASIAVQELMRLMYFAKGGDLSELEKIFWVRVGTSGGVGLEPGSVVVTTEALMSDLEPYRVVDGPNGEIKFDPHFPAHVVQGILDANADKEFPVVSGKTVCTNEFFLEQFRLDGAIRLTTPERKLEWLRWLDSQGVRNIEMEGAMLAGYLNYWGFTSFAMICVALLNRLEGDQVPYTPQELAEFSERAGDVMFTYLRTIVE